MKLSQLSLADYNQLDSIPVINQDLSASGFTPVANTYYRHTGATTDTFTQGVIYLYDTAYHKLGESGGTKLNQYTYSVSLGSQNNTRIINILKNAKSIARIGVGGMLEECIGCADTNNFYAKFWGWSIDNSQNSTSRYEYYFNGLSNSCTLYTTTFNIDGTISISKTASPSYGQLRIVYYNDIEITA